MAAMTAGAAAAFVIQALRVGKVQGQFDNRSVHMALQVVGSEFVLDTLYTRALDTVTVAADSADVVGLDAVGLVLFNPERVRSLWIDGYKPLIRPSLQELLTLQEEKPTSGRPTHIAFIEQDTALVYPTPDAAYTINLLWSPPFTSWALPTARAVPTVAAPTPADDTSKDSVSLNLPDDVLKIICATGVPAQMMQFAPEHARFIATCQEKYEAFKIKCRGGTSQGSTSSPRSKFLG